MSQPSATPTDPPGPPTAGPPRWRRWLLRFGVGGFVLLLLAGVTAVGTEYYTSRPHFCGSCHIMHPYYDGWSKDVHSEEANVRCVDCHYAPGEQHTLRAKFRGLSQVTSYFSGRAGAGRPKAHVNDASCMTSGCHNPDEFMTKEHKMGNVTFTHTKHLDPESENLLRRQSEQAQLRAKLLRELGAERFAAVDVMARDMRHAEERNRRLNQWVAEQTLSAMREDIVAYGDLVHLELRVDQLKGLKCSSCHQFDPSLNEHFSVAQTTCFTCHFTNQPFNANTGRCLSCHEPPAGPVPVHYGRELAGEAPTSVPTTGITMDHATILANNVNCVSCHAELIHGTGQVARRDCQNCHDQERFVKDFDGRTTEVVRAYHRVHAAGQHARCNDCHQTIEHRLTEVAAGGDLEALLAPVRQDCQHCHPDHHREQVQLLLGQGGLPGEVPGVPNPMSGSRATCKACHTQHGEDPKGDLVVTSTLASCRGCHGEEYEQLFDRWKQSIQARLEEAQTLLGRVQERLAAASPAPGRDLNQATRLVSQARQNIHLVASANGIHNKNYALMLLDQAILDLDRASVLLPE